jgi:hypothetical protein
MSLTLVPVHSSLANAYWYLLSQAGRALLLGDSRLHRYYSLAAVHLAISARVLVISRCNQTLKWEDK